MRHVIENDVCPQKGAYSPHAESLVDAFTAARNTTDIDDTLEVACPYAPDCGVRFELYLSESRHGGRNVRHGFIGEICLIQARMGDNRTLDNRGNL